MKKTLQLSINLPFSYYLEKDSASGTRLLRYPSPRMIERYVHALCREMELFSDCKDAEIRSIRFEGGYIHMLKHDTFAMLLDRLDACFTLAPACEWTALTCPGQYTQPIEALLAGRGFRLILDVPTFIEQEAQEHLLPFGAPFQQINLADYGAVGIRMLTDVTGRTEANRRQTLECLSSLHPSRVELITLSGIPESSEGGEIRDWLIGHGYVQVERDAYALPHGTLVHTRDRSRLGEFVSLGLGAVSRIDGFETRNTDDFARYIDAEGNPAMLYEETRELGASGGDSACGVPS